MNMGHRFEPDLLGCLDHLAVSRFEREPLPGYPAMWHTVAKILKPHLHERIRIKWVSRRGVVHNDILGTLAGVEGRLSITSTGTRTIVNVKFSDRKTATLYSTDFTVTREPIPK